MAVEKVYITLNHKQMQAHRLMVIALLSIFSMVVQLVVVSHSLWILMLQIHV